MLLALSLAVSLALVEVAVRVFDPFGVSYYKDVNRYFNEAIELPPDAAREDGHLFVHRRGTELDFATFDFATDAAGLRAGSPAGAPAVPRSPDDGALRVVFLGDSVTLGWGVDDAATWVRTVERDGRAPRGARLDCLNGGYLHYDTVQEADWLASYGPLLRPDVVVLTFVVNDLESSWAVYEQLMAAQGERGAAARAGGRVRELFRGLFALAHLYSERQRAKTVDEHAVTRVEDAPHYAEGWARSEAALARLRATCAELGARLIVLDHTVPEIPAVRRWCEASDVPYHAFRFSDEEWARGITNSVADAHANELGNRLLADKALAALTASGVLAE